MKLTATQQLILNALQGIFVHDFKKGFTHVGPKRVAWAAQVSYDRARRALAQLHALGLIQKLMPQVQLFLVIMPLQIWGGLALFGISQQPAF